MVQKGWPLKIRLTVLVRLTISTYAYGNFAWLLTMSAWFPIGIHFKCLDKTGKKSYMLFIIWWNDLGFCCFVFKFPCYFYWTYLITKDYWTFLYIASMYYTDFIAFFSCALTTNKRKIRGILYKALSIAFSFLINIWSILLYSQNNTGLRNENLLDKQKQLWLRVIAMSCSQWNQLLLFLKICLENIYWQMQHCSWSTIFHIQASHYFLPITFQDFSRYFHTWVGQIC